MNKSIFKLILIIIVVVSAITLVLVGVNIKSTQPISENLNVNVKHEEENTDKIKVSGDNAKNVREDVCELYLKVLEDLWNVDSGLNSEISQIGIDFSELSHLTEDEKDTVMSEFASKHNLPYIAGTFEELCEQGVIDKENLYWKDGLLFSIKTNENAEWNLPFVKIGDPVSERTSFNAQKWRSGLGAYFFGNCTAQKNIDGTWTYTVGQEAIS